MVKDGLRAGDDVVVPGPMLGFVQITGTMGQIGYASVRVDEPSSLLANNVPLSECAVASGLSHLKDVVLVN